MRPGRRTVGAAVLARLIERPGFDPRAWLAQLPPMDLYGALLFQVTGQPPSTAPASERRARGVSRDGNHVSFAPGRGQRGRVSCSVRLTIWAAMAPVGWLSAKARARIRANASGMSSPLCTATMPAAWWISI